VRVKLVVPLELPLLSVGDTVIATPLEGATEFTVSVYVTAAATDTELVPLALLYVEELAESGV